jgi:hypothetical protein
MYIHAFRLFISFVSDANFKIHILCKYFRCQLWLMLRFRESPVFPENKIRNVFLFFLWFR